MRNIFHFSLLLFFIGFPEGFAQNTNYNIQDFGAIGDSKTKNTEAIKKAIAACAEAGGGTVYFPAGTFLTGAIHLKSNINLHVSAGATILFSTDHADYPTVQTRWEGVEAKGYSPLIYANGLENVSISGRGTIDGQGWTWWKRQGEYWKMANKDTISPRTAREKEFAELNKDADPGDMVGSHAWYWRSQFLRPAMIQFYKCKNVLIENVTLQNSSFWTVHPVYCEGVTVRGITILNPQNSANTDGINPDSSKDVHISDCHIDVGDDCITIKSGRDTEGRKIGIPSENITITNCTMKAGHGGIVIGSEMSGGVKNVTISNCVFNGTDRGIRVKTQRGRGGTVENFVVNNLVMENVGVAIVLNMNYTDMPKEPLSERTPSLKNFRFNNLIVKNAEIAGQLVGIEEMPIEGLSITNSSFKAKKGIEGAHLRGIKLADISMEVEEGPAFGFANVNTLEMSGVSNPKSDREAVIKLEKVEDAFIYGNYAYPGTGTFLYLTGDENTNIVVENNNLTNVATKIESGVEGR